MSYNLLVSDEMKFSGERLIQYATENLVTEVLIHPQTNTLLQCIRNLLASFTKHRHIIHAGYTFGGNGSWILQVFSFSIAIFDCQLPLMENETLINSCAKCWRRIVLS